MNIPQLLEALISISEPYLSPMRMESHESIEKARGIL